MATLTYYLDTRTIEKEKENPGSTKLAGKKVKKAAVYFKLSHRGVQKQAFVPGLHVDPEKWDQENQKVRGYDVDALNINDKLNKINQLLTQDIFREKSPYDWTCADIRDYYKNFNFFKNQPYQKAKRTLVDFTKDYIKERHDLSHASHSAYRRLAKYLKIYEDKYHFPLVPENITDEIITSVVNFFSEDEVSKGGKVIKKKLSAKNVKYMTNLIKGVRSWYSLPFQPPGKRIMSAFHTIHQDSRIKEASRLTIEEVIDLYNMGVEDEMEEKVRDTFVFCCFTGPRFDELFRLTKDNIELIMVNENGQLQKFQALCYFTGKNNNKYLQVALNDICLEIIKKWSERDFLVKRRVKGKRVLYPDALLPVPSHGSVVLKLKTLFKRLGLTKKYNIQEYRENQIVTASKCRYELVTFHKSRHTFGSYLLQNGCSLETVQQLLGHSDLKTTQIYADKGRMAAYEGWKVMGNSNIIQIKDAKAV